MYARRTGLFRLPGYVHSGGCDEEHKQVRSAGFRHLIIMVYITMRQDPVTPAIRRDMVLIDSDYPLEKQPNP